MIDFYKTPAGARLIDETLPEIAEQLGRLADIALIFLNDHLELPEEHHGKHISLPAHSAFNGMPCKFVSDVEGRDNRCVVEMDPEEVLARFPNAEYRQTRFQEPWGGYIWYSPGSYYSEQFKHHIKG